MSDLLSYLRAQAYRFVTPNRGTHRLVSARRPARPETLLRDVFGWNRPFTAGMLPEALERSLLEAGLLFPDGAALGAGLRVSTVDDALFAHSTLDAGEDAVFLGPDSYRFARFLRHVLAAEPIATRALDIGTGAGVGAITLLRAGLAQTVVASDTNPLALRLARLNAAAAGETMDTILAPGVPADTAPFDLIIANPPFIAGSNGAAYRDGGGSHGAQASIDWVSSGLERLTPKGRFVLYSGAPVIEGEDILRNALGEIARSAGRELLYAEIDPDIFGDSLRSEAYREVERIAAVGAVIR